MYPCHPIGPGKIDVGFRLWPRRSISIDDPFVFLMARQGDAGDDDETLENRGFVESCVQKASEDELIFNFKSVTKVGKRCFNTKKR